MARGRWLLGLRTAGCIAAAACLTACGGGGGGGGDFVGAADVWIGANPTSIDTGDRLQITLHLSNVVEDGIAVKLRYPVGLSYVPDSARLTVDGNDIDLNPQNNTPVEGVVYLVFYLSQAIFGENNRGELVVELEGIDTIRDGEISVDADVNDPAVDDALEFDPENPEFSGNDSVFVSVGN